MFLTSKCHRPFAAFSPSLHPQGAESLRELAAQGACTGTGLVHAGRRSRNPMGSSDAPEICLRPWAHIQCCWVPSCVFSKSTSSASGSVWVIRYEYSQDGWRQKRRWCGSGAAAKPGKKQLQLNSAAVVAGGTGTE